MPIRQATQPLLFSSCMILLAAAVLPAAAIRGTVVENQTGHPLARALVGLQAAGPGPRLSTRTNSYGSFEFPSVPAGAYLITAARRAFAPAEYGQKRWNTAGVPVAVAEDAAVIVNIRLPRYGSVTGTLIDENDVGLPDQDVVIYRNSRPPFLLARSRTDDRGMYRFFGLEPGKYLVRTATRSDAEGAYLPTFYRDTNRLDQAMPLEVTLDQQLENVNIHPSPGRLFTISGRVAGPVRTGIKVTLSSDMGRLFGEIDAQGNFKFDPAAPGQYELLAEADGGRVGYAAFQSISLDRDIGVNLGLTTYPTVQFVAESAKTPAAPAALQQQLRDMQIFVRRREPAGPGPVQSIRFWSITNLLPGRYDVALPGSSTYYPMSATSSQGDIISLSRADCWNELVLTPGSQNVVKFVLSNTPSTLRGTARTAAGLAVPNTPVYLEAYDVEPVRRIPELYTVRTDANGAYQFTGLAPGTYRVLATAEFRAPDPAIMELAAAKTVRLDEGRDVTQDVEAYVIR